MDGLERPDLHILFRLHRPSWLLFVSRVGQVMGVGDLLILLPDGTVVSGRCFPLRMAVSLDFHHPE